MDYDALRMGMAQAIPFNMHLGLDVAEVGDGRGVVRLPDVESLRNHVGSQHAGALFSAGEAASGAAFVGAFADRMGEITPLARSADISYLKLARGPITATGSLGIAKEELLAGLDADGKVEFPIQVDLSDQEGNQVAAMTVHWHIRSND
jgi:acyl-coenzyme A thioesterase PaaI-like protein